MNTIMKMEEQLPHELGNCNGTSNHHSGSNIDDSKSRIITGLKELFGTFENEVWNYSSLRPDEAFKINLDLPLLVTEMFSKLFRLWKNYDMLRTLITPEKFRQIYVDMNQFFQNMEKFELFCDTCEVRIPIQGDLLTSYDLHSQNERHREILENFNRLMCLSKSIPNCKPSEDCKSNSNGTAKPSKNTDLRCITCDESLKDEKAAVHHRNSLSHRLQEQFNCDHDADTDHHIIQIEGVYCCRLCRIELSGKEYEYHHLLGKSHKEVEDCYRALKKNKNIVLLNKKTGEFMCDVCHLNETGWSKLLSHYYSDEHTSKVKEFSEFISFENGSYECILCQKILERSDIEDHKKNAEHKMFVQQIMSEGANTLSHLKSSGLNDAFKNNDIYIEVILNNDSTEFKCLLCNKNGKGLNELDTHCLTSGHQKMKINIETVSAEFNDGECRICEEPAIEAVEDEDDTFYCKVCSIVIYGMEDKLEHELCKKHITMEQLNEVLSLNGKLISNCLGEDDLEGPKLYHCYICQKTIDGDANIVSHGKSARHRQLFEIVKQLSRIR